jgi:cellulose biosynthesis protein BcsQ
MTAAGRSSQRAASDSVVIAIAGLQPGSGKTHAALHLGAGLAAGGASVLIADTDPQNAIALTQGISMGQLLMLDEHRLSLSSALLSGACLSGAALHGNPQVLLAGHFVSAINRRVFAEERDPELALEAIAAKLGALRRCHDFVLIDCSAAASALTTAAIWCADVVLLPGRLDPRGSAGIVRSLAFIDEIRQRGPPGRQEVWVLPRLDPQHPGHRQFRLSGEPDGLRILRQFTAIEPVCPESAAAGEGPQATLRLDWHLKALRGLNVINPCSHVVRRALEWRTSAR